jgi:hypothetical protein
MKTGTPMIVHMPFDSVETLEEAKLPPGAARAIVRVIAKHVTEAVSHLATKDDLEEFKVAMKRDSDDFRTEMRREFANFQAEMRREFTELQRQMFKWFLAFLGVMLPAYTSLAFFMVQYVKK